MAAPTAVNQLSLVPLGAGDLIDRAVRLYRRHFMTLVRIAAPPVIVSTVGSLMLAVAGRSTRLRGITVLLLLFGLLIQGAGLLLNVIVMSPFPSLRPLHAPLPAPWAMTAVVTGP